MKVKTVDLIDAPLDWAVAECLGATRIQLYEYNGRRMIRVSLSEGIHAPWEPSRYWGQSGQIIEREEIGLRRNVPCSRGREWEASPSITAKGAGGKWGYGPTPLIAAMRCFVASRLGEEVDIPEELLK